MVKVISVTIYPASVYFPVRSTHITHLYHPFAVTPSLRPFTLFSKQHALTMADKDGDQKSIHDNRKGDLDETASNKDIASDDDHGQKERWGPAEVQKLLDRSNKAFQEWEKLRNEKVRDAPERKDTWAADAADIESKL